MRQRPSKCHVQINKKPNSPARYTYMPGQSAASTDNMSSQPVVGENRVWTRSSDCLDIDIDSDDTIETVLKQLAKERLWHKTRIRLINATDNNTSGKLNVGDVLLDEKKVTSLRALPEAGKDCFELFFIPKHLDDASEQKRLPTDQENKLRINPKALKHLILTYRMPWSYVSAIARGGQFNASAFRKQSRYSWDYWCLLQVRISRKCNLDAGKHVSNQLDSFNHIHLDGVKKDIRPSKIGLYIQRNNETGKSSVICFNLLRPQNKYKSDDCLRHLKQCLTQRSREDLQSSPCFVLLVFIAHSLRWWNETLQYFNSELGRQETIVQMSIRVGLAALIEEAKGRNPMLHAMAAHLHHSKIELNRIGVILSDLRTHRKDMTRTPTTDGDGQEVLSTLDQEAQKIDQLESRLAAICSSCDQSEKKVQILLTLLSSQIQISISQRPPAMQYATPRETIVGRELVILSRLFATSMNRESIATKTIAIMTIIFLPGVAFAVMLAMPYFAEGKYVETDVQLFLWLLLTAACIMVASFGYWVANGRESRLKHDPERDSGLGSVSVGTSTDEHSAKETST